MTSRGRGPSTTRSSCLGRGGGSTASSGSEHTRHDASSGSGLAEVPEDPIEIIAETVALTHRADLAAVSVCIAREKLDDVELRFRSAGVELERDEVREANDAERSEV